MLSAATGPQTIIIGICICIFAATGVVTLLALVGMIHLGGSTQEKHDYYLKRLFHALLIEIIGIAVAYFGSVLNANPKNSGYPTPTPSPYVTPTPAPRHVPVPTLDPALRKTLKD
jgi:hypothetical protein